MLIKMTVFRSRIDFKIKFFAWICDRESANCELVEVQRLRRFLRDLNTRYWKWRRRLKNKIFGVHGEMVQVGSLHWLFKFTEIYAKDSLREIVTSLHRWLTQGPEQKYLQFQPIFPVFDLETSVSHASRFNVVQLFTYVIIDLDSDRASDQRDEELFQESF